MPGINWKYNQGPKTHEFWSNQNDCYIYLGQLFIDFEFEFNQSLSILTDEFELNQKQVNFLIVGLENRIDNLIEKFKPMVHSRGTPISNIYKGIDYNFYIRSSHNHKLINRLIKFHKFLVDTISSDKSIIFWGGEFE